MTKENNLYIKIVRGISLVSLYFIWPSLNKFIANSFNINSVELWNFSSNFVLLLIILFIYHREIIADFNKISYRKIGILFLILIGVQLLFNSISVMFLGVEGHSAYGGLLSTYLSKWPVLIGISLVVIYPIVETIIFSKTFKDVINNKWIFIFCASLFFWLVNLFSFDFKMQSIIATMSCFTTSIVINYYYYKYDNITEVIMVKMIYNLIFLLLP